MRMKLGSLFDGSGGFPLAASMCGIEPVWASEIEPYPIAVTRSRFPNMLHLGDITKIHGDEIPPVDIVTFGSPCQDLSAAGKRAGLKHESNGDDETTRSGLFIDAVRRIKEMRKATNGKYPTYVLWENVPGAFSSNNGEDFRTVLEELIKIVEPSAVMPEVPKNGWPYADSYIGNGWSLAYRVFDAQYWGVPQRRRRIHLILDLRGNRARKILFEREGLSGYSAEGFRSWQRTAGSAAVRTGTASLCLNDQGGQRMDVTDSVTATLRAGVVPATVYENHSQDTRYTGPIDTAPTVSATYGMGGNNQPFVVSGEQPFCNWDGDQVAPTLTVHNAGGNQRMPDKSHFNCVLQAYGICSKESNSMKSDNPHSGIYEAETSRTIDGNGGNPVCNQGGIAVVESYAIQGSMIGRNDKNGPQGDGINEDVSFTLNTVDRHAVFSPSFSEEVQPTMVAKGPGAIQSGYAVRRLTPTECARLQGFPDTWGHPDKKDDLTEEEYNFWLDVRNTHAEINGKNTKKYTKEQMLTWYSKLHTDSAEYKMWGNGIALPPAVYCMEGIKEEAESDVR